jgi:signal transduction histidine kinase/CheY-like chemotaxis protein
MEKLYKPPEGPSVPSTVLLSAFPFVESGQITSIMSCMTDVSRLKWAEAWQARAARDAREAKRRQGEFTDAISHEIRNPLSAIMQLADDISLSLDNVGEKTVGNFDKCIEVIQQNVEHAKTIMVCAVHQRKIVDDVLTISRLDFQSITLSPNSVQPSELVDSAVQMLQADITAANIKLQVNAHMSIHDMDVSWVMCDSLRLTQVLLNLIGNSIKFTKLEKRREITLEYGSSVSLPSNLSSKDIKWVEPKRTYEDVTRNEAWGTGERIYLTFSISDTGPGMTHEECLHLFRKFQQAGPQTSIKYGGSGLGLYISQALVEKHCGSIGLASEHGKGSTFVIVVKVRRSNPSISTIARLTEDLALEKTDGFHVEKEDANTLHAPKRRVRSVAWHILLVEDNLINQRILQKQLVKAGCLVTVANHGQEALDILRTTNKWRDNPDGNQLDAVLMDIEMPVMDGLTATREIRALESSGDLIGRTEILAVSANARPEQVERAVAAGVDGCVPKPFLIADLLAVIATRIGSREKKGP